MLQPTGTGISSHEELSCVGYQANRNAAIDVIKEKKKCLDPDVGRNGIDV